MTPELTNLEGDVSFRDCVGNTALSLNASWNLSGLEQSAGDAAGVSMPVRSHCGVTSGVDPAELFGNVAVWISKFPRTRTLSPTWTLSVRSGYSLAETPFQKPPAETVSSRLPPDSERVCVVCASSSAIGPYTLRARLIWWWI